MGNLCCTDRRLNKLSQSAFPPHPMTLLKSKKTNKKAAQFQKLSKNFEFTPSSTNQPQPSQSINLNHSESSAQELQYSLQDILDLSAKEQENILSVFNMYKNEIPLGHEEYFEGFSKVKVKFSDSGFEEKVLLMSNFSIYVLKLNELSLVCRRILLVNIQVILLSNSLNSCLINVNSSDIMGDLWIFSIMIEDIHNCVQTMFKDLTQRFIPVYCFSETQLNLKYNNIPKTLIQTLLEDNNLKANNVLIIEGKLGEYIISNQKSQSVIKGEITPCHAVLTSKSLYCLSPDFSFISKLDLKNIKSIQMSNKMDKFLIEKKNGEFSIWLFGGKFLTELEKAIILNQGERVPITRRPTINIKDFT